VNQYGTSTIRLHAGLPTDRCIAEWWIASPRVEAALAGRPLTPASPAARISVPAAIGETKASDPERARMIQERIRGEFVACLEKGWAATGFEHTADAGTYLLGPWES
jgi:predicted GNAT superfamily acetyltransferase